MSSPFTFQPMIRQDAGTLEQDFRDEQITDLTRL